MIENTSYANKEWVKAEVDSLKQGVREAKAIGLEARKIADDAKSLAGVPHTCSKALFIDKLRDEQVDIIEEVGNWKFFKKFFFVIIAIMATVTLTAAGAVIRYAVSSSESVSNIEHSVNNLDYRHSDLVNRVNNLTARKTEEYEEQLKRIELVIENALRNVNFKEEKKK